MDVQATPERYTKYGLAPIDEFFAMGRGLQRPAKDGAPAVDVPSLVRLHANTPVLDTETPNISYRKWSNGLIPITIM